MSAGDLLLIAFARSPVDGGFSADGLTRASSRSDKDPQGSLDMNGTMGIQEIIEENIN